MSLIRPLHIVQLGSDDSVFQQNAPSDSTKRQLWYGEILAQKRPDSRLTCFVLTKKPNLKPIYHDNVAFVPIKSLRFVKNILVWNALRKLHREREVDVISPQDVDSVGWIVPIFGKLYAIPSVAQIHYDLFSQHSMRDHMGWGISGWLRKKITFFFLRRFSAVRVVGQAVRTNILKKRLHSKVSVIPVPVTLLQTSNELNHHDHKTPRVLFVGRLSKEKNLFEWLNVAKLIHEKKPAVEFDIVGDGPLAKDLKKKALDLGLGDCVNFLGSVPYEQLADIYRSASVFLLTSHYEGFGRVLVEASAYGLPSVAPRMSGVEDIIIDNKTGFLCEQGDLFDITDKVLRLIAAPELRCAMGQDGERYVTRTFSPKMIAETWVDCLIDATAGQITLPPLRPTWKRWWKQSSTQFSVLRGLEYESIDGLTLYGRTLDIGGGKKSSYLQKIIFRGEVESVNIDRNIQPTFIADLNNPLPIKNAAYDNFVSLNTFEHIFQDRAVIREAIRVLKPGGYFHIIVPFLYKVHGSPYDFHRHPEYWWSDYLKSLNILPDNITIEPLLWDMASSGFAISEFQHNFRGVRKRLAMLPGVFRALRWKNQKRLPWLIGDRESVYALGYHIHGKK
ncbi:MAG: glycosyltransferase [Anaerolineales bacterium]|nr:glycosyltransferase [Anaerolineales bacterium]